MLGYLSSCKVCKLDISGCDFSKGSVNAPAGRTCVFSVVTSNSVINHCKQKFEAPPANSLDIAHLKLLPNHWQPQIFFSANNLRWFTLFYYGTARNALLHSTPGADQVLKDAEKKHWMFTTHVFQHSAV